MSKYSASMDAFSAPPTTENSFALTDASTRSPSPQPAQTNIQSAFRNGGIRREAARIFRLADDGQGVVAEDSPSIPMMDVLDGSMASVLERPTRPNTPPRVHHNLHPRGGLRRHLDAGNLAVALQTVKVNQESEKVDPENAADPEADTEAPAESTTPVPTHDAQPTAMKAPSTDNIEATSKGSIVVSTKPEIPAPSAEGCGATEAASEPNAPAPSTPACTTTLQSHTPRAPMLKRKWSSGSIEETMPNNKGRTKPTAKEDELPQHPNKKARKEGGKPATATKATKITRSASKAMVAAPSTPPADVRVPPTASARAQKVAQPSLTAPSKARGTSKKGGSNVSKPKAKAARKA